MRSSAGRAALWGLMEAGGRELVLEFLSYWKRWRGTQYEGEPVPAAQQRLMGSSQSQTGCHSLGM